MGKGQLYYCKHVRCKLVHSCKMIHTVMGAVVGGGKFSPATHNSSICSLPKRVRAVHVQPSGTLSNAAPLSMWVYEILCVGGSR